MPLLDKRMTVGHFIFKTFFFFFSNLAVTGQGFCHELKPLYVFGSYFGLF